MLLRACACVCVLQPCCTRKLCLRCAARAAWHCAQARIPWHAPPVRSPLSCAPLGGVARAGERQGGGRRRRKQRGADGSTSVRMDGDTMEHDAQEGQGGAEEGGRGSRRQLRGRRHGGASGDRRQAASYALWGTRDERQGGAQEGVQMGEAQMGEAPEGGAQEGQQQGEGGQQVMETEGGAGGSVDAGVGARPGGRRAGVAGTKVRGWCLWWCAACLQRAGAVRRLAGGAAALQPPAHCLADA